MPTKSSIPLNTEKDQEHVLITEYLTGTNKLTNENKIDEHNIIAVSPNDHRWYRSVKNPYKKSVYLGKFSSD